MKDEGGPLGIGFQEQVSNHSKRLRLRGVVVSVGTKRGKIPVQVSIRETNESEPFDDSSLTKSVVKTRDDRVSWDQPAMSLVNGRAATGE